MAPATNGGERVNTSECSSKSEHFIGNECSTITATNAVQSSSPPCTVVTCDDRYDTRSYSVVVQKITHLLPRSPQVATLQRHTMSTNKFYFFPHFPRFPGFPPFPPFPLFPKVSSFPPFPSTSLAVSNSGKLYQK